jgi:hypothetical protein
MKKHEWVLSKIVVWTVIVDNSSDVNIYSDEYRTAVRFQQPDIAYGLNVISLLKRSYFNGMYERCTQTCTLYRV